MKNIKLNERIVGVDQPVFIVGEIGSNHNRDKKVVKKLINEAAKAGFNAIKFQIYEPLEVFSGKITTRDVNYEKMYGYKPWWKVARDRILMPRDWFKEMFEYAREKNLIAFSTVHSIKDAEFIMKLNPPCFKVASIDVTYLEFLKQLAKFKKPILLSTGMSHIEEIRDAVDIIRKNGNSQVVLLHCVSCYPPKPEIVNLNNIRMLREEFNLPVGFSDHSLNNYLAIASVALGSCLIEKHITLDRKMKGPDHTFALTPNLMRELVVSVREVEKGLGSLERELSTQELDSRRQIRRSVVTKCKISKGEIFSREKVKLARPGTGIIPKDLGKIIGKKAKVDIGREEVISWGVVE